MAARFQDSEKPNCGIFQSSPVLQTLFPLECRNYLCSVGGL